jgi:hypothetical protein
MMKLIQNHSVLEILIFKYFYSVINTSRIAYLCFNY